MFEFLCDLAVNEPFKHSYLNERFKYSYRIYPWRVKNPRQTALEAIIEQYPDRPQTLLLLRDRAENDPDVQLREFARKQLLNWVE